MKALSTEEPNQTLIEQVLDIARVSSLEEMASGFAHELNQPLGAITTFAQAAKRMLMRPDPMIKESLEVLEHISEEALKAGEGIRQIRRLFHRRASSKDRHSMGELIIELRPLLDPLAKRYNVQLDIGIAPGLPMVIVDKLRIQHVVLALFLNAVEASKPGDATPSIDIEVKADPYFVETSITDHGIGISSDARHHIFMPFFTTKPHGTGLGLASSRAIVEALGGTIGFEPAKHGGTRFWFKIPTNSDHGDQLHGA